MHGTILRLLLLIVLPLGCFCFDIGFLDAARSVVAITCDESPKSKVFQTLRGRGMVQPEEMGKWERMTSQSSHICIVHEACILFHILCQYHSISL